MKKVAGTGHQAGTRRELPLGACIAGTLAVCIACPALADDAGPQPADVFADARTAPQMRLQVQTSTLPRLEAQDGGFQAPRVDVSLFPANSSGGLGAVVGFAGFTPQQQPAIGLAPMRPSVDFGLRFSHKLHSQQQIDVTAWRRMNSADDAYSLIQAREQPVYGARFEVSLSKMKKSGFLIERGLGLQLESGARISIRRRNGGPMVYYRTSF